MIRTQASPPALVPSLALRASCRVTRSVSAFATGPASGRLPEAASTGLDDDVARLSPLGHDHITMLGHYSFEVPEIVAQGHLRPLSSLDE